MISFVIATYNSEDTIQTCLESFRNQTDSNFELIIVDGQSDDSTIKIVDRYMDVVSYCISEPDSGIYDAWNKGVIKSSGNWISFLGSDDMLESKKSIEKLNGIASSKINSNFVYGISTIIDRNGVFISSHGKSWTEIKKDFYRGIMKIPHQGMLHNARIFTSNTMFDAQFKISGDFDLLFRVIISGVDEGIFFTNTSAEVVVAEGGISHDYRMRIQSLNEVKKSLKKNGVSRLSSKFRFYYLKTFLLKVFYDVFGERLILILKKATKL